MHTPLSSILEPKGEIVFEYSNALYVPGIVLGHFTKIISAPSRAASEAGIFTAEDVVIQVMLEAVWHRVQDHGLGQQTDLGPNLNSWPHEWGMFLYPQSFSFSIPKGRV